MSPGDVNVQAAANDLIVFAALVQNMRDSQKQYFKTRDKQALIDSKAYEHFVDRVLELISEGTL